MNTSSKKEFSLTIDGKTYQVKVEETAEGELEVELDGKIHRVSMAELVSQEKALTPPAAKRGVPTPVVPVYMSDRTNNGKANQLSAPMPGDIVKIMVKIGDQVGMGQEICVLEAMKMKNILRASSPGVVKSIAVSIGQSVNYGDVLVQFEP
jgi:biotin carboxyl carrier protein